MKQNQSDRVFEANGSQQMANVNQKSPLCSPEKCQRYRYQMWAVIVWLECRVEVDQTCIGVLVQTKN